MTTIYKTTGSFPILIKKVYVVGGFGNALPPSFFLVIGNQNFGPYYFTDKKEEFIFDVPLLIPAHTSFSVKPRGLFLDGTIAMI